MDITESGFQQKEKVLGSPSLPPASQPTTPPSNYKNRTPLSYKIRTLLPRVLTQNLTQQSE